MSTPKHGLMLLDLGLPKVDGMEILRSVRARDDAVPVLVTTARDTVEDRIKGLDHGAEDYVLKPFEMSELLARMRAVIRRKGGGASGTLLSNGNMSLDPVTREAIVEGARTLLSAKEFALLHALMAVVACVLSYFTALQEARKLQDDVLRQVVHLVHRQGLAADPAPAGVETDILDADSVVVIQILHPAAPERDTSTMAGTLLLAAQRTGVRDEIRPFVTAINDLLNRVQGAMDQQRRFLADAAHELRTPLTALTLQAEQLASTEMPPSAKARVRTLMTGLSRARQLVEQLLTYARVRDVSQDVVHSTAVRAVAHRMSESVCWTLFTEG
nr:response regulator [Rhodoferax aquaticus]